MIEGTVDANFSPQNIQENFVARCGFVPSISRFQVQANVVSDDYSDGWEDENLNSGGSNNRLLSPAIYSYRWAGCRWTDKPL